MTDFYPIIEIDEDAPEFLEQQGNKTKYWLRMEGELCLFKIGREKTGENWAEKVACELCELLGLPHANYEFATLAGQKGVFSGIIIPPNGRLVMGNELLAEIHSSYPKQQRYKVQDHTLGRIATLLSSPDILPPMNWQPLNNNITNAADVFLGYLLLDTWIANQDRHHENWAVINYDKLYLAPTYDHAASMGQNESDVKREEILQTNDKGRHISHYVTKARSAIYSNKLDKRPMLTIDVFQQLAKKRPEAANYWLQQLQDITNEQCQNVFNKLPSTEISEMAIEFAMKLLELNKKRLLVDKKT